MSLLTRNLTQPLLHPLVQDIRDAILLGAFSPLSLFTGGVNGGWYDPSDLTTLWQDSARTTPVTASGQPVGCMDDKSGNGRHLLQATAAARLTYLSGDTPATFGSELVTNGTFAADTDWTKGAGWTIAAGVATGTGTTANLDGSVTVTAGKLYRLVYTISGFTAGTVRGALTGGTTTNGVTRSADGTYTEYLRAEAGNTTLSFDGVTAFTGNIDNVSLMEVLTFTGYPCLLSDAVDDCMAEAGTHTLSVPVWVVMAAEKVTEASTGFFGSFLNSTNLAAIFNSSSNSRAQGSLRITSLGNINKLSSNNKLPVNEKHVVDSLSIAGTTGIRVDAAADGTVANAWTTETIAGCKIAIANGSPTTAATLHRFYGGAVVLADSGTTMRAAMRTWLGRKIGLTI